jgi:hypothetical protein
MEPATKSTAVEVTITHICDHERKQGILRPLYGDRITDEEIARSALWVLWDSASNWYALATVEVNACNTACITRFAVKPELLSDDGEFFDDPAVEFFYFAIEEYCVEEKYQGIVMTVPTQVPGLSEPLNWLLQEVGFDHLADSSEPDRAHYYKTLRFRYLPKNLTALSNSDRPYPLYMYARRRPVCPTTIL